MGQPSFAGVLFAVSFSLSQVATAGGLAVIQLDLRGSRIRPHHHTTDIDLNRYVIKTRMYLRYINLINTFLSFGDIWRFYDNGFQ